ncbi:MULTISPECIES: hypothetical protein [unclassified Microcoleus]|uniref:hypothetical protein n=1 Tax=unclassified Microcoleus TaxID=2642155 RepID=UPI002FD21EF8
MATIQKLPVGLAQFLRDMRLIIFGLLIVLETIFFTQKLVTPELFKRWKNGDRHSVLN